VKRAPEDYETLTIGPAEARPHENTAGARDRAGRRVSIPAGRALLGTPAEALFAWDNERPAHIVDVPAFEIDLNNVTNAQYLAYMEANPRLAPPPFWECEGGTWYWRGMFERVPLPADWPVYVTWTEADAYARWSGGRLPTEAEYHRAAFGTPSGGERHYPWGDEAPSSPHGNFDFQRFDRIPTARAHGAYRISSGMGGSGRQPCSQASPGSSPWRPIPSTPPTSSMASIT
jgi:iron(II)-dependent oxidoreductase